MQVEDLLQENVKEFLDYHDAMNKLAKEIIQNYKTIDSFIPEVPSDLKKPEYSKEHEAIKALLKTSKECSKNMHSLQEQLGISVKKLKGKAKQITLMDSRAAKAINEVLDKINEAQVDVGNVLSATMEQMDKVGVKLNAI
jgi:methyl-accepting chemotaxis protein